MKKYQVEVKYSRIAIPDKHTFDTKKEALDFQEKKEIKNPYVVWTELKEI